MLPQNVGTSMNLQIVLNTPKTPSLNQATQKKYLPNYFTKTPPQTPSIIPITWNPEYSPGDCFINDWYFSKKCRANVSSENIIMVINPIAPWNFAQKNLWIVCSDDHSTQ